MKMKAIGMEKRDDCKMLSSDGIGHRLNDMQNLSFS
jgi:hypothetical protein